MSDLGIAGTCGVLHQEKLGALRIIRTTNGLEAVYVVRYSTLVILALSF